MKRRKFLTSIANVMVLMANPKLVSAQMEKNRNSKTISLFLCGDVMTGRGIDQVMPYPGNPQIYEYYMQDARRYVEIAERANGPIPKPVDYAYIWGDAKEVMQYYAPDVRIINLETSVTQHDEYWPGKGIQYRMHPRNIPCITAAGIDCCVLANNHVLDWGYQGLQETLKTLHAEKIQTAGAGDNLQQAEMPAIFNIAKKGRVLVFAFGLESSGIPRNWAAKTNRMGVNLLPDLSSSTVKRISAQIQKQKAPDDIVVASIHWGGNWGYEIELAQIHFAHQLIDMAGVDIIHGHSSHHAKGMEVYQDKPIVYGCGDFINDYEGIKSHQAYRGDLTLMYFVQIAPDSGKLVALDMVPMQMRRFRLNHASQQDAQWLSRTLTREGKRFNNVVKLNDSNRFSLNW